MKEDNLENIGIMRGKASNKHEKDEWISKKEKWREKNITGGEILEG